MKIHINTKNAKALLEAIKKEKDQLSGTHKKLNKSSNYSESDEEKREWYVEDNRFGLGDKNGIKLIPNTDSDHILVFSFEDQIITDEDGEEAIKLFQDLTYFLVSGYVEDVESFRVMLNEK